MRRTLEVLARTYKVPYILIARPGTFGSTGNHADRRRDREYLVMRQAVEAMRQRLRLQSVTLAGQSGGATIAAAVLTLGLEHVKCAVPASGGYDLAAMLDWHASRQGTVASHREHPATLYGNFDVMERVGGVPKDPDRRIFIVGDREDRVTPFPQQRRFAEELRKRGHHAELIEAEGKGPERHGLTIASLKGAGLCANGASDAEIRRAIGR